MLPPVPSRVNLRNLMNNRGEAATMRRKAQRHKANRAKTKLGLPDLEHAKSAVLVRGFWNPGAFLGWRPRVL